MLENFGLDFRIVNTELLRSERGPYANPWTHFPQLIVSMDYLNATLRFGSSGGYVANG